MIYTVILDYTVSQSVEIEADSEEDAAQQAEAECAEYDPSRGDEASFLSGVGVLQRDDNGTEHVEMQPVALPDAEEDDA